MKLISICIPVLNEEENIVNAYDAIDNLFKNALIEYKYEIIFTDNNSSDDSENIITKLANKNKNIKYIRFKKNLGYDKSILEAYKNSLGDAIEVYAQERKKIKSLLTVENLSQSDKAIIYLDRCRDAQPIHDQSYSSFGREEERYRLALNQNMLALTHLYQLLGKSFEQSSCLNQQRLVILEILYFGIITGAT